MTESSGSLPRRVRFENSIPILRVRDMAASLAYYRDVLGFTLDWGPSDGAAQVSRDGCGVMLMEGAQGHAGTWVWMGVDDAAALHEEYRAAGARVRMPPTNLPWALEFDVLDPDDHVLRLGSEPLEGEPYGPWLDERGTRWARTADGGWERVAAP